MAPSVIKTREASFQKNYLNNSGTCQHSAKDADRDTDTWNSELYSKAAAYIYNGVAHLVDLLQPQPGDRILDLGCGSGEQALAFQNVGCKVVAIDSSASMVEAAKAQGVDARLVDAHDLDFDDYFDAMFSNMSLHWMSEDPRKVVRNVARSLKKNGRFVAEFAGEGALDSLLKPMKRILERHGVSVEYPWYLPSKEEYSTLLESEGMDVEHISLVPKSRTVPGGVKMWLELYAAMFFLGVDTAKKQEIYAEIEAAIDPSRIDDQGRYHTDDMAMIVWAVKRT